MSRKEKRAILILIIITIILIIAFVITRNNKQDEVLENQEQTENISQEGNTQISNKEVNGIEISNINISANSEDVTVTANATNNTNSTKDEFTVKIKLKNAQGEILQELGAIIGKTNPGETRQITATVGGVNVSDIEDIEITTK